MTDQPVHARPSAPPSVRMAVVLTYLLVAFQALRTLFAALAKDSLVDVYAERQDLDTDTEIGRRLADQGAPNYLATGIISLLIFGAIMLLLAYFFQRGSNGARWTTVVLAVLGFLGGILAFVIPSPIWYQLIGFATGLICLAIAILLLKSDARAFFAKR